jgi:hypothetical protein
MRLTNVRQFIRGGYLTATEPVQVIRGTEVLGIWTPVISPPVVVPELAATPERTIAPDGSVAGDLGREFRPYSKSRQAKGK